MAFVSWLTSSKPSEVRGEEALIASIQLVAALTIFSRMRHRGSSRSERAVSQLEATGGTVVNRLPTEFAVAFEDIVRRLRGARAASYKSPVALRSPSLSAADSDTA